MPVVNQARDVRIFQRKEQHMVLHFSKFSMSGHKNTGKKNQLYTKYVLICHKNKSQFWKILDFFLSKDLKNF